MTIRRQIVPEDNLGAPCRCLDCQAADVTHLRIVRVPADEFSSRPRWLHGEELRRWWQARDTTRRQFADLWERLTMPGSKGRRRA